MRIFGPIFAALAFLTPVMGADRGPDRSNARIRADSAPTAAARSATSSVRSAATSAITAPARQTAAAAAGSRGAAASAARTGNASRAAASAAVRPMAVRAAATDMSLGTALGNDYVGCRDAYFSCMDQFCALRNEQYRRCTCSSRLAEMREREQNFRGATNMLKTFEDNNLAVAALTPNEVKAMYKASEGEAAMKKDNSKSAQQLAGIADILAEKSVDKSTRLLDMPSTWDTNGMVGGSDLSSLESTGLYNVVHAQCTEAVAPVCADSRAFNMIATAYGMYIEQDCASYAEALDKQQKQMTFATKQAKGLLAAERLQNYDNLNADEINECLKNVRIEMYGPAACGENNIKCLDYTGRYINATTGTPIYSTEFYKLSEAISLSGDILVNGQNAPFIDMLNKKKRAALAALDKCRGIADFVWEEYLRQALVDLSQQQYGKVRMVFDECVGIVNKCYDDKLETLRAFTSDLSMDPTMVSQMVLAEEMCKTQLDTCAILYGGGPPGLEKLRGYVRSTQEVKMESTCSKYLNTYIQQTCTPVGDSTHSFPYQCRFKAPGGEDSYEKGNTGGNSLYSILRNKAKEQCVRPDSPDLTSGDLITINQIMDDIKFKMDAALATECNKIDKAVWHTKTLGTWDDSNWAPDSASQFSQLVNSHNAWGICVEPAAIVPPTLVTGVSITSPSCPYTIYSDSIPIEFPLQAAIFPPEANNKNLTWNSSNGTVALADCKNSNQLGCSITLCPNTTRCTGETTITVSSEDGSNRSADCKIQIIDRPAPAPVPVNNIRFGSTCPNTTVNVGNSVQLTATLSPASPTNRTIIWNNDTPTTLDFNCTTTTTNPATCNVTVKNKLTQGIIKATSQDGNRTVECKIVPTP